MEELASVSVSAVAAVFEIGADFGFVVLVEGVLVAKLVVGVGEGALPSFTRTIW